MAENNVNTNKKKPSFLRSMLPTLALTFGMQFLPDSLRQSYWFMPTFWMIISLVVVFAMLYLVCVFHVEKEHRKQFD